MRFADFGMLNALWLAAIAGLFLWWALKHRRKLIERFVSSGLLDEVAIGYSQKRYILKSFLKAGILFFSVLALARPQWGFGWQEIKRQGIDILLAIDTSKSMLTEDVKPNRLERTKLAVKDLIPKLKGDRVGLIAFAGDAFLVCPLTIDYNGFLLALNDLDTNTVPRGGTNIGAAIKEAMSEYEYIPSRYKAVVVMTDGENLEGDPIGTAQQAKDKEVRIFTIGIGTQEGELIQYFDEQGNQQFLKDRDGNFVKSRLNEGLLAQIAQATGGIYARASGVQFGLGEIYDQEISKMEKREIESKMEKKYYERFQYPLAIAFIFLILDSLIADRKK